MPVTIKQMRIATAILAALLLISLPTVSFGQALAAEEAEANSLEITAISTSLEAITSIIASQNQKEAEAKKLRLDIKIAETDVEKAALNKQLDAIISELNNLDSQIESLATGASVNDLAPLKDGFDLQSELEQLIRPFVWILKSATENARGIEELNRTILRASQQKQTATDAISRLELMIARGGADDKVAEKLDGLLESWKTKLAVAQDLGTSADQQLKVRLSKRAEAGDTTKRAFTSFFNDRGRNLVYGILGFAGVVLVMRLIRRVVLRLIGAPRNRSFPVRIGALIFDVATAATAFGTTIAIFNRYNDWLLTGLMLILFLGIGWFILKSIPSLFEQVTLLLNLGAVQEGERLVKDGVPWKVTKLDLYSKLENPLLRGGSFTVPVRELRGHHSREIDENEEWFPTEEGDWVVLDSGLWAEVILQSPEVVQLREEGGAISYHSVQSFIDQNPKNLESGYRVTAEFGLDYSHQSQAVKEIPNKLRDYIEKRLPEILDPEIVSGIYVTLFRAGASSLDYEIEVDVGPNQGHLYEPIEHAVIRYAIECSSDNGWQIPFLNCRFTTRWRCKRTLPEATNILVDRTAFRRYPLSK